MEQSTTKQGRGTSEKGRTQDADLAAMEKMYADTMRSFSDGSIVKGRILEIRPTDVLVDIGYKSEGAIPISEFKDIQNFHPGDEIEVLLESLEDDDGMVVLSYQKAQHQRSWDRVVENYTEGAVIEGVIKGRVKGGMIVDVGVDAFLPGSQVDLVPVKNPDDLLNQKLEFKILKINKERRNIVLSRRELLEERRREQKRKLLAEIQPGQIRKGVVKNITDFGAFVDLNGMDGLLHVTDMSWGRINHPSEMLTVGQEIEVVVLDVNPEKERISLSHKQLTPNPWEDADIKYPVGSRVRGRVVSLAPYGAFVQLEEGIEGLVHVSEMSWTKRVNKASDVLAVGDIVEAVVLAVNPKEQKLSLGIRQTEANPWDRVLEKYPVGSRIKGVVRNFTNYGAFVELEPGIDGMIHVSDMSWTRKVSHPNEVLKKGDEVEAVVLEVDPAAQRIALGLKQAQEDPWTKISERFKVGMRVKGKVTKLASFGAFVEIEAGVDGLVHISQISEERVQKVRDVLQPGQEVEARVIKVDPIERRIGLSIKAAKIPDDQFVVDESMLEGLRPGESLVDMAGALEAAISSSGAPLAGEEWTPGQPKTDESGQPNEK
jgi:small subunit ribosomal protein S1